MDAKFLEFYNQELKFIREMGSEFAKEYPKIAGRLGLEGFDCSDPYIERLLEGFAFLSARIHLKLDASFPNFTQHLMELLFPTFLQPAPSMLIAQFNPDFDEGSLVEGVKIPKNTSLHSLLGKGEQTACHYRTSQDVTLWPVVLNDAEYLNAQEITNYTNSLNLSSPAKSGILLSLKTLGGHSFNEIAMDSLSLFLKGSESFPLYLFEALYKGYQGCLFKVGDNHWRQEFEETHISTEGYHKEQALLPFSNRQFDGFRLLKEYFLFLKRFLFISIDNLKPTLSSCTSDEVQILLLLDHSDTRLEKMVSSENFSLYCAPAINLFPKKADRVSVTKADTSFHIVADKLRPLDFEVCQITRVLGFNTGIEPVSEFKPMYSLSDGYHESKSTAHYTTSRESRKLNVKQRKYGYRSSYIGSELYISLVDSKQVPYSNSLKQLSVETLCSNRDLPLMMPLGKGTTDFSIETGAPCESVRCIGEPTRPHTALSKGSVSWDLINQLSINFLGMDDNGSSAVASLKSLLTLMMDKNDYTHSKQIEGIVGVEVRKITRRLPLSGPICFARGVEVEILIDEYAYEGSSAFMLGMVLDHFFAQYVSVNSFTQLVLLSVEKGEIFRWPIRIGLRNPI